MDYSDSTIAVSATVEEQAFRPALRCQTNGLSAPVPRGYTNSGIALNESKQCPTLTPFLPAMTRVRAHQERLIHCLAIPRACLKNSFVSGHGFKPCRKGRIK